MTSLEYVKSQIVKLKDDLQHYTMVEKDSALASQIRYDLEQFEIIEQELKDKEKKDKALAIIKNIGILKPYRTCGGQCWLETICDATKITKDNYDLLKEELL